MVSYCMLAVILYVLIRGKCSLAPVFIVIPFAASILLGYSVHDICQFATDGINSVLNTALLFAFSILYFSILEETGLFKILVGWIMRFLKNSVYSILFITMLIAAVAQLDGSGAMTMLITLPAMLPIYDEIKIRRVVLVFTVAAASGMMNMMPWCSSVLRLSAATNLNAREIWLTAFPLQIIGLIALAILLLWIARIEKKNGAELSNEEFAKIKVLYLSNKSELGWRFWFNLIFTVILIGCLLLGIFNTTLGFMIGFSIILVINYPKMKMQNEQIKKHGATAYPLVVVIFALGVMIGIMRGTGMVNSIAESMIVCIPASMRQYIPVIFSFVGVPVSTILGSDCAYGILAPILGTICEQYGASGMQATIAVLIGACMAANITVIGPVPYLSLGLAKIEMKENLSFSFKYMWLLGVILTFAAIVLNIF